MVYTIMQKYGPVLADTMLVMLMSLNVGGALVWVYVNLFVPWMTPLVLLAYAGHWQPRPCPHCTAARTVPRVISAACHSIFASGFLAGSCETTPGGTGATVAAQLGSTNCQGERILEFYDGIGWQGTGGEGTGRLKCSEWCL